MKTENVMLIAIAIPGDRKKPRRYKNDADRGTAFNMEGSCEYIEYTVADSKGWSFGFGVGRDANKSSP